MQLERPFVLSIAGLDPSAGAGLLADIKTFEALRVYGLGVSSAITVQDEEKVYHVTWLSVEEMIQQADVLFNKYTI
ncbi:MAG: hydroxymethylpyrimidine/phosphomethylpyrimidine kinase, partial [Pedobacter sp.]